MNLTDPKIEDYCRAHTTPLPPVFAALREATFREAQAPQMQVGLLEGRFLGLLVALSGARTVLELGTFTGFSALAMAEMLPENGKLITCDVDPVNTAMARKFWGDSPHGKKIELRLGPGLETIAQLRETIDLAFIDADKTNYLNYWEAILPKLRVGGLIVVDNVLWSGAVLDPKDQNDRDIHALNEHAVRDPRVDCVMLPVRDGMLLARKK